MADSTLILLVDEVRRKTLELLEDVTDEQARWSPNGLQNSILWHAGHCYILLEWLTSQAVGSEPTSPGGWFEMFGWNSRPAEVKPAAWPSLETVIYELRLQHGRIRKLVANLSEERLTSPALGRPDRTPRFLVVHALHDEACHGGEIWLLRKMLAAAAR
jgi:hypothetical protein